MSRIRGLGFATLSLVLILISPARNVVAGPTSPPQTGAPAETARTLKRRADEVLRMDNIVARTRVDDVFAYAEFLHARGNRDQCLRYLRRGLQIYPWSLRHQLMCAEILLNGGRQAAAAEHLELIVQHAEDDASVVRALTLLDRKPDLSVPAVKNLKLEAPAAVLVPMGEIDVLLFKQVAADLEKTLGIPVTVAGAEVKMPPHGRAPYAELITSLRDCLKKLRDDPEGGTALRELLGDKADRLDSEKDVVAAWETVLSATDPEKLPEFRQGMATAAALPSQWDINKLQQALKAALPAASPPGVVYVGVTRNDLYRGDLNFLFGQGRPGIGVISYARFRTVDEGTPPSRPRLKKRILNQCLSTIGFTFKVPRCTSPLCPRAYPNSLEEHDAKGDTLCPQCRRRFDEQFRELRAGDKQPQPPAAVPGGQ